MSSLKIGRSFKESPKLDSQLSNTISNNTSVIGSAHDVITLSNFIPLSSNASAGTRWAWCAANENIIVLKSVIKNPPMKCRYCTRSTSRRPLYHESCWMKAHGNQNEVYVVTTDRSGRDCIVEKASESLDKAIKFSKSDNLDNRHLAYHIKKMKVE